MTQHMLTLRPENQPALAIQLAQNTQEGLSVHPTSPNALEKDLASPNIGPFGWIGIALCIIIAVIAAVSIFQRLAKCACACKDSGEETAAEAACAGGDKAPAEH